MWCVSVGYSWIRRRDLVSADGLTAIPHLVVQLTVRHVVLTDLCLVGLEFIVSGGLG